MQGGEIGCFAPRCVPCVGGVSVFPAWEGCSSQVQGVEAVVGPAPPPAFQPLHPHPACFSLVPSLPRAPLVK